MKNIKKLKNQPKKDKSEEPLQGVDQLLNVNQLWGVDKNWKKHVHFQSFLSDFKREITEKDLKRTKNVETAEKKYYNQLLGALST